MRDSRPGSAAHPVVEALIERSRALGADRRNTNEGGGNTSAKGEVVDPATGNEIEVVWVKGSGGDLATLTEEGLSSLIVDRLRGLERRYRGEAHEDEMHELLSFCAYGSGGAAPSIDTAMHGLLPVGHVDHLHPDPVIALAASADGESLVERCYGDEVGWVPWRRPGFELGLRIAALYRQRPRLKGVVLGGHGLTAWGRTSEECQRNSLDIIRRAAEFIAETGRREPLGPVRPGFGPLPLEERRRRAARLAPAIRALASNDRPVVGRFSDAELVLDFLARERTPLLLHLGTSCPDHFIRTKVRPLCLDLPTDEPIERQIERLRELHGEYRREYREYYERYADASAPPMRGADPVVFLVPGVGMFTFGVDPRTARLAGEFYASAIHVIRGAEAVSSYSPVPEPEKFRVEYWWLEEQKLRRLPAAGALQGRVAFVTGGGSGIGRATARRLRAEGAAVVVADLDGEAAKRVAHELGAEAALGLAMDVADESQVAAAIDAAVVRFGGIDIVVNNAGISISKPLEETSLEDWDRQHTVLARGSFLVSREATRVLRAQGRGGSIVYVVSKNAVVPGPNNVAYGSAKASQAHQVRLLAAELGQYGIRVNGVSPDGVVQGSKIFAEGWGADRAKVYGVREDELGKFYASRTLLKQEVLPEHVAEAIACLVREDLRLTTGTIIPVDSGVPGAFMR